MFTKARMARRARPTLHDSSSNENAKRKATVPASNHWPITIAPTTAMVISRFISARNRRKASQAFGAINQPPITTAAA